MRCCFPPKFLLAAAAAVATTWFVVPGTALSVAVVLLALTCPVSTFATLRENRRAGTGIVRHDLGTSSDREPDLDEQIQALRTEIEELRDHQIPAGPESAEDTTVNNSAESTVPPGRPHSDRRGRSQPRNARDQSVPTSKTPE